MSKRSSRDIKTVWSNENHRVYGPELLRGLFSERGISMLPEQEAERWRIENQTPNGNQKRYIPMHFIVYSRLPTGSLDLTFSIPASQFICPAGEGPSHQAGKPGKQSNLVSTAVRRFTWAPLSRRKLEDAGGGTPANPFSSIQFSSVQLLDY